MPQRAPSRAEAAGVLETQSRGAAGVLETPCLAVRVMIYIVVVKWRIHSCNKMHKVQAEACGADPDSLTPDL